MRRSASLLLLALAGCAGLRTEAPVEHAYLMRGEGSLLLARALVQGAQCPSVAVDGQKLRMQVRTPAGEVPARPVAQGLTKPARFDLTVCEATLPAGARSARVASIDLPVPAAAPQRIVVIGDTGCRMKQSEDAFQPCHDSAAWPFAQVARSAAAQKPDLVIHVGDYHYRESPCPAGQQACAGSPWGFGQDTWTADFFQPAQPLLRAAPWVFVRGNHESCARAGQGWFRFLDAAPWSAARSCDDPARDAEAAHTPPFAVDLDEHTRLVVFDSSEQAGAAPVFASEFAQVDALAQAAAHAIFVSHHPVLGLGLPTKGKPIQAESKTMLSALQAAHGGALFATPVELALHGHVHLFEALGYTPGGTPTFVLGNSGSMTEGALPDQLPAEVRTIGHVRIDAFYTRVGFGFALLERAGTGWRLTEFDQEGRAQLVCGVSAPSLHCQAAYSTISRRGNSASRS
jgi:hypothetical protein